MIERNRHALGELLTRLSDGSHTRQDSEQLNAMLRGDPEACEIYLNQAALEGQLHREFDAVSAPVAPAITAPTGMRERRTRFAAPIWLGFAAAVAIAACVTWFAIHRGEPVGQQQAGIVPEASAAWIATILYAEDCDWGSHRALHEGERIAAQTIRLVSGTAIVRFDGGAEMVLRGESELELQSPSQARLIGGDVVVRADKDAVGFRLLTPVNELIDLGTEFAVKVHPAGATELHVLEGEVAYELDSHSDRNVLHAGKALRFDGANTNPVPVSLNAAGFDELVRNVNPRERRDLMRVYEGFHYAEGYYAPEEITRGKGWTGPWRLRRPQEVRRSIESDSTTDMHIVHAKLNVRWPVEGGRLGMLELPAGQSYRIRQMAQPIAMDRDGITYFSIMTQEPERAQQVSGKPAESIRLTFRSSADYWGESLSFGCDSEMHPRIATADVNFSSPVIVSDEQSLLWIGKIIRRADGEDEVSFRIYGQNDALEYAEPATWHVVSRGLRQAAAFDLVVLSSTGASPRIADELRIGPTWRSVVPIETPSGKAE